MGLVGCCWQDSAEPEDEIKPATDIDSIWQEGYSGSCVCCSVLTVHATGSAAPECLVRGSDHLSCFIRVKHLLVSHYPEKLGSLCW
jgi:hypothetical protein